MGTPTIAHIALLAWAATPVAVGRGTQKDPGPPSPMAPRRPISSVAWVGDRTRDIEGHRYRMMAVRYDPRPMALETDTTTTVWVINGSSFWALGRPVDAEDRPVGKLPADIGLMWLRLPLNGDLEMLFGVLRYGPKEAPGRDPEADRRRLIARGCIPFTIAVANIPTVHAGSAEELARKIKDILPQVM